MALLAKKIGMVSTWPMPMKRSRVLTMQAMISDSVENSPEPSTMAAATPRILSGIKIDADAEQRAPAGRRSAPATAPRTPAESALPSTSAERGAGLTR